MVTIRLETELNVCGSIEANIFRNGVVEEKEYISINCDEVFKSLQRMCLNMKNKCNSREFLENSSKLIKKLTVTKIMVCVFLMNLSQLHDSGRICQWGKEYPLPILQYRSEKKTFKKMYSLHLELAWILFIQGGFLKHESIY